MLKTQQQKMTKLCGNKNQAGKKIILISVQVQSSTNVYRRDIYKKFSLFMRMKMIVKNSFKSLYVI